MPSLFAELATRQRAALIDCVARELRSSLGVRRSAAEAEALAKLLDQRPGDALAAWSAIQTRARSWKRRGVPMRAIGRVLSGILSLAAKPAARGAIRAPDFDQVMQPMLDAVPTPVLLIDGQGRVRLINDAVRQCCPIPPEAMLKQPVTGLFSLEWSGPEASGEGDGPRRLDRLRFTAQPEMELTGSRFDFNHASVPGGWFLVISSHSVHSGDHDSLNERLQNEITQKEKFAALLTVSHAVVNTLDLNNVFATIAKQVRQVIQTDECTVFLLRRERPAAQAGGVRRRAVPARR